MNILNIISSMDPAGGGPIESIKQLRIPLVANGHRVEIASLDAPDAVFLKQSQLPIYALGPPATHYAFSPRLIPWLRANRSRYDAVIVNGIWQFHSFATWCALRNSSTPYVTFTHGMLDPWFRRQYPLKHLKKWIYWPWAEYRVLRDAQAVLFTCDEERRLARQSFWLYRCNEIVVNLGTAKLAGEPELELQQFFDRYPELRHKKLVLFMGRIHFKKGCDLLIEAFAKVMRKHLEWHLVIAGPDQVGWQKKLSHRAEQLGVASRITWTGMLSGTLKWGALRAAEMFVLPSHQENFGIVVAEALAVGVPTLLSDKVNIWREIEGDGAGMVAADTLPGTCELLQSYLDLPEKKRCLMSQRARECFDQRFEISNAAKTLETVLATITGVN
jgi:glycosyltransferase involved in cell wall biosynthesis